MRELRIASIADGDIVDGGVWFERQRPTLGGDFLDAVQAALDEITQSPLACPTLILPGLRFKAPLRWLGLGRFPYLVIFEVTDDEIVIYAVVNSHRDLENLLRERIGVH
jgi:hypothetical protein